MKPMATFIIGSGVMAGMPHPEEHRTYLNQLIEDARDEPIFALGNKRTSRSVSVMSALPPKADMSCELSDVR
jgi:hypothetical protein